MGIDVYPDPYDRYVICTSATRPSIPFAGLMIFETDTFRQYVYTGTAWYYLNGGTDPTAARGYASALTAVQTTITQITLGGEAYDYGNNFASNAYTAPRAGLMDAKWRVSVSAGTDGQRFVSFLYKNGAQVSRGADVSIGAANPHSSQGSDTLAVVAGDVFTLQAQMVTGTAKNSDPGTELTFLACRMLP